VNTLVWIFGGILLLDALFVTWFVLVEVSGRWHERRDLRELDRLWRSVASTPAQRPSVPVRASGGSSGGSVLEDGTWAVLRGAPGLDPALAGRGRHARRGRLRVGSFGARPAEGAALVALVVLAAVVASAPTPPRSNVPIDRSVERAEAGRPTAGLSGQSGPGEAGVTTPEGAEGPGGVFVWPDPDVQGAANVPEELAAQARSSTAIRLVWDPVPDAIRYVIQRSDGPSAAWSPIASIDEARTAYTDTGLESNTTYYYRVVAVVQDGPAPPSDIVSATTPVAPPSATEVTAFTSDLSVLVTWVDVAEESGYRIERSLDGADDWTTIGTTGQDVTAYTDGALSPGATYLYRVVAVNEGGDSPPSNVVAVTVEEPETPDEDPEAPDADPPSEGSAGEELPELEPTEAIESPSPSPSP
jgi:hypothetical protein